MMAASVSVLCVIFSFAPLRAEELTSEELLKQLSEVNIPQSDLKKYIFSYLKAHNKKVMMKAIEAASPRG